MAGARSTCGAVVGEGLGAGAGGSKLETTRDVSLADNERGGSSGGRGPVVTVSAVPFDDSLDVTLHPLGLHQYLCPSADIREAQGPDLLDHVGSSTCAAESRRRGNCGVSRRETFSFGKN